MDIKLGCCAQIPDELRLEFRKPLVSIDMNLVSGRLYDVIDYNKARLYLSRETHSLRSRCTVCSNNKQLRIS